MIAMVGAFQPPSDADYRRLAWSIEAGLDPRLFWPKSQSAWDNMDIVNLIYGRDFLAETKTYDAVVLHSLYHTENFVHHHVGTKKTTALSALHSEEHWNCRLRDSGAKLIFVWHDQPFSLQGWHIGEIEGYRMMQRDRLLTMYRKRRASARATKNRTGVQRGRSSQTA